MLIFWYTLYFVTEASLLAEFLPLGLRRSSSLKAIALSCLWDGGWPGQREGQRLFGEVFGAFFAIFCIFGFFWTHLMSSFLFFFTDFFRFWIDFAWFLEGFGRVFGGPFPRFFTFFAQIAFLCESQQNTAWAHEFSRSTFQKTRKFPKKCQKKLMKLYGWKKQGQNSHKY